MKKETMWVALNDRGKIRATWYRGCVQPFQRWRRAVRSLGYYPVRGQIAFGRGEHAK